MIHIQILGIGCKKSRALKANLLAALRSLPVEASIEEVVKVEDIIKYQILATPALLINQHIVSEGYVPEVPELQFWLKNVDKPLLAMKKILVPTDFSHTAANAFHFALDMAKQYHGHLSLLHVYHPYFDPENPLAGKRDAASENAAKKRLEAFIGENISPANRKDKVIAHEKINKEVYFGFAADEIVNYSAKFDLVVMGTTGDGDWLERLFGSVSSHVAQHARCPVLLVPPKAKFKGFKTVVYASEHSVNDRALIRQIVDGMELAANAVHLVHVEKRSNEEYLLSNGKHELIPRVQKPLINVNLIEIKASNVLRALNEYAETHRSDLIIMNTAQRGFLENIFHRSLTKQMVLHATTPLLILHTSD